MTEALDATGVCNCGATHDELAAMIVSSYVGHNPLPQSDLPALYTNVRKAVSSGATAVPAAVPLAEVDMPTPAQIKKSIRPEGIVSFIDGKMYKTLKRHLTKHSLTPDTYRARYGLPADYPIVSQNYSEQRSELAKQLGLGQVHRTEAA